MYTAFSPSGSKTLNLRWQHVSCHLYFCLPVLHHNSKNNNRNSFQSTAPLAFLFSLALCPLQTKSASEPLYQFWVWCLGVINHVGHQLAAKQGPLWGAHLFGALGRARSLRADAMKGWVWEGPAEKTRVGGSIGTQSVCGTPAGRSYSNVVCTTPLLAYNSEIRD